MSSLFRALRHPGERAAGMALRLRREAVFSDRPALIGLVLMTIVITIFGVLTIDVVPYTAILLPLFIGSLWLWPKSLPWFVIFCLACVVLLIWVQPNVNWRTVVRIATTFLIAFVILWSSFRRIRLGVSGPRGESMLVDLRERITKQSQIPQLPAQWQVESRIKSAGGTQFSGDFVVASKSPDASSIELLVVDVSGKGVEAGTRALLLSGAFGGLTSAVPYKRFLKYANEYLLGLDWDEGFATAIHVHLNLHNGDFVVRKAGHPPAVWMHAGSGQCSVLDSEGPILGVTRAATFDSVRGRLLPGDALLMYTDGLVETTRRDLSSGIDRLAGRAVTLFQTGFDGGVTRLINELSSTHDDGGLLLIHRRPGARSG